MEYPKTIRAIPTRTYGKFIQGNIYVFTHVKSRLYQIEFGKSIKYQTFDPKKHETGKSAHLWDGEDWSAAGKFLVVE